MLLSNWKQKWWHWFYKRNCINGHCTRSTRTPHIYIYLFPYNQTRTDWLLLLSSAWLQLGPVKGTLASSLLSRRDSISWTKAACLSAFWLNMSSYFMLCVSISPEALQDMGTMWWPLHWKKSSAKIYICWHPQTRLNKLSQSHHSNSVIWNSVFIFSW